MSLNSCCENDTFDPDTMPAKLLFAVRQPALVAWVPARLWHLTSLPTPWQGNVLYELSVVSIGREIHSEHLSFPVGILVNNRLVKARIPFILAHVKSFIVFYCLWHCSVNFEQFLELFSWFYIDGISVVTPKWESQFSQAFWKPLL